MLPEASSDLCAQALGLALAEAAPVPQVNLRKGDLAYRSDYSFLRGKARFMSVATLCILACAGLNAAAALRGLRKEADALELQMKAATTELFGTPMLDGRAVSEELKGGPKGGAPNIPSVTAFDVLGNIVATSANLIVVGVRTAAAAKDRLLRGDFRGIGTEVASGFAQVKAVLAAFNEDRERAGDFLLGREGDAAGQDEALRRLREANQQKHELQRQATRQQEQDADRAARLWPGRIRAVLGQTSVRGR